MGENWSVKLQIKQAVSTILPPHGNWRRVMSMRGKYIMDFIRKFLILKERSQVLSRDPPFLIEMVGLLKRSRRLMEFRLVTISLYEIPHSVFFFKLITTAFVECESNGISFSTTVLLLFCGERVVLGFEVPLPFPLTSYFLHG